MFLILHSAIGDTMVLRNPRTFGTSMDVSLLIFILILSFYNKTFDVSSTPAKSDARHRRREPAEAMQEVPLNSHRSIGTAEALVLRIIFPSRFLASRGRLERRAAPSSQPSVMDSAPARIRIEIFVLHGSAISRNHQILVLFSFLEYRIFPEHSISLSLELLKRSGTATISPPSPCCISRAP